MTNFTDSDPHKEAQIFYKGKSIESSGQVMIMIHGRGASAADILSLAVEINNNEFTYIAPQANGFSWYPNSFLSPIESNEPFLSSSLNLLKDIVKNVLKKGIQTDKIFLLGFSQGACLTLEFAAKNPKSYGGVFALSGGLIGPSIEIQNYSGSFEGCRTFLGCSDIDPHIPIERVNESAGIFKRMNADVEIRIYKEMGHTINKDEIDYIKSIVNETGK